MEEIYKVTQTESPGAARSSAIAAVQAYATVSVGICATVELQNTLDLARRILKIDDPSFRVKEVIVATPNSTLALRLAKRDARLVVLFEEKREGKTSAINKILAAATGDILVIASADIAMRDDAIPRLVRGLIFNEDWGLVDSRVQIARGDASLMGAVNEFLWAVHNATLDDLDNAEKLAHAGDMFAVRRELVDQLPNITNDDAHIALEVKTRGFRVKRDQKALVWIRGPSSPEDYILQRTRILRGHLQLISQFRTTPTTFEFSVTSRPLRSTRLFFGALVKLGPSYIPALITSCVLEIFSLQLAILGMAFKRREKPWKLALTTKPI